MQRDVTPSQPSEGRHKLAAKMLRELADRIEGRIFTETCDWRPTRGVCASDIGADGWGYSTLGRDQEALIDVFFHTTPVLVVASDE